MLRRICGPKRDDVTGEWRRLHKEQLYDLYSSPNIIRVISSRRVRWAGHAAHMWERRGVYRVLLGNSEGKRTLGRSRRRLGDNIKMDVQEVVSCEGNDNIVVVQDRGRWQEPVNAVMNLRVP